MTALKNIQKKLHILLKNIYRAPDVAHAFILDKSIVTNASVHVKTKTIVKVDLKNFFGVINFGRVRGLFLASPFLFNSEVATTLAQICCRNNRLPQGAPTSPIIANMICRRLDTQLNRLAKNHFFLYTRYADDLTFSSNHNKYQSDDSKCIEDFITKIDIYVKENGLCLNDEKTIVLKKRDSKYVTGIKVNEKLNVSRRKIRSVRAMIDSLEKNGPSASLKIHLEKWRRRKTHRTPDNYIQILFGKISFLKMVKGENDLCTLKLENRINEWIYLRTDSNINTLLLDKIISLDKKLDAVIYTEGKTDRIHLRNAFFALRKKELFKDINIIFYEIPKDTTSGDTALKAFVNNALASEQHNGKLRILIFDRDSKQTSKQDIKIYGNNIFSIRLPLPEFRQAYEDSLSIEHYYNDSILFKKDENGRRLFKVSEFDSTTQKHNEQAGVFCTCLGKKNENTIIGESVFDSTQKSIALSKVDFARNIGRGIFEITGDDLLTFKPLFDKISSLIKKYAYPI